MRCVEEMIKPSDLEEHGNPAGKHRQEVDQEKRACKQDSQLDVEYK